MSELARELGASKSTVHRFLATLEDIGYVEQDEGNGSYRVGSRVLRLAGGLFSAPFADAAHAELADLTMFTGETAHVGVLDGLEVVYVDEMDSPHPLRLSSHVGMRLPAYSTALGKALLAWLPEAERRRLISSALRPRTSRTITDPGELLNALEEVKDRGYAVDDEEEMDGVRCIAAPIFDIRGSVAGAIGIGAPSSRLGLDDVPWKAERVMDAARCISTRLGAQKDRGSASESPERQ